MKAISVIVPCYNVERYIDRCAASLVGQTLGIEKLELIFVDDASTDGTMEKLAEWEQKYPESILVVHCEENRKQGAARNIGLQYASAEYVGFVDADDCVSVKMYEDFYNKAKEYDCDLVGGLFVRSEQDGTVVIPASPSPDGDRFHKIETVEDRKKFLVTGDLPGGVWGKIYKRNIILENEIYFPENRFYEDNAWGFYIRYVLSSYYIINETYYYYMINYESTIVQKNTFHHLDRLVVELEKLEECKRRGWFGRYHDEIEFNFLRLYFINTLHILFTRLDKEQIPCQIIYTMQAHVKKFFPAYEANPYLHTLPDFQKELLSLVSVPLDEKDIAAMAAEYRKAMP